MNLALIALALHQVDAGNNSMWIIIIAVVVVLFLLFVVLAVGVAIFFVMRKKKQAQLATPDASAVAAVSAASQAAVLEQPVAEVLPMVEPPLSGLDTAEQETSWPESSEVPAPAPIESEETDFDPSRTVAIVREATVEISYGQIKFVSGVLSGEQFAIDPAGSYIGREPSLSQIVVSDPRISKRHLWVGVRDGAVMIVDQESRNGTFLNDPRSERVHEAKLNPGDVVIMGESDVARFEYVP